MTHCLGGTPRSPGAALAALAAPAGTGLRPAPHPLQPGQVTLLAFASQPRGGCPGIRTSGIVLPDSIQHLFPPSKRLNINLGFPTGLGAVVLPRDPLSPPSHQHHRVHTWEFLGVRPPAHPWPVMAPYSGLLGTGLFLPPLQSLLTGPGWLMRPQQG